MFQSFRRGYLAEAAQSAEARDRGLLIERGMEHTRFTGTATTGGGTLHFGVFAAIGGVTLAHLFGVVATIGGLPRGKLPSVVAIIRGVPCGDLPAIRGVTRDVPRGFTPRAPRVHPARAALVPPEQSDLQERGAARAPPEIKGGHLRAELAFGFLECHVNPL
jgi:hypothetical protein